MDFEAIVAALDARTLAAFKAWGETFAAGMRTALDERDATILRQAKELSVVTERLLILEKQLSVADAALTEARTLVQQAIEERDTVIARFDPSQKQVRDLVEAAIMDRPLPSYAGVFDEERSYRKGEFVTDGGSLWHCNAETTTGEKPGKSEVWTLAVKRGRDGKDAGKDARGAE